MRLNFLFFIFVIYLFFTSCKKIIDIGEPRDQLVTATVFADTSNAKSAVLGIYATMMSTVTSFGIANGAVTASAGLSADEMFLGSTNAADAEFYSNSISPENTKINTMLWRGAYKIIYQANACLEGLSASTELKSNAAADSVRKQLMGECKVVRAFIYFNLINLFGDVPYIVSSDYRVNRTMPRTQATFIYEQLIAELLEARSLLSINYVSSGRVRPNKYTASALLARVYLYLGKWQEAEQFSTEVITAGMYITESNLNDVFLAGSREAIWQLRPTVTGYETTEGQLFIPTTSTTTVPAYPLSDILLAAFEPGDKRKINNNWVKTKVVGGKTYYYPFKYKLRMDNVAVALENYMVLRFAEQMLIRAEARARQQNTAGALQDLNAIRSRSGLGAVSFINTDLLLTAIEQERKVELFAEWGHRWFDLKRTNRADAVLGVIKGAKWQTTDKLYPVPFDEIEANPFLLQNAGY